MKSKSLYITVTLLTVLFFTSCGNNRKNAQYNDQTLSVLDTIHNSRNSLDHDGTYTGTFPCADCSGINIEITLNNGTYTMKSVYEGKEQDGENTFTESGTYTWDNTGSIIIFDGDDTNRYQVGENTLIALDENGNRITGDLADMYILRKKQ